MQTLTPFLLCNLATRDNLARPPLPPNEMLAKVPTKLNLDGDVTKREGGALECNEMFFLEPLNLGYRGSEGMSALRDRQMYARTHARACTTHKAPFVKRLKCEMLLVWNKSSA